MIPTMNLANPSHAVVQRQVLLYVIVAPHPFACTAFRTFDGVKPTGNVTLAHVVSLYSMIGGHRPGEHIIEQEHDDLFKKDQLDLILLVHYWNLVNVGVVFHLRIKVNTKAKNDKGNSILSHA
jgi:hypothetical protein